MDEEQDVNLEESSETPEESSTAKTEDKTVPYTRFKEVNEKMKAVEKEVESLKAKESGGLTPEQQKELEAKTYLKNLLKETLKEEKEAEGKREKEEQTKFNEEVDEVVEELGLDKKAFLKWMEDGNADKYGATSARGAANIYQDLEKSKKEGSEETKKDISSKPGLPKHEGASGGGTPRDDSEKSLTEIASEEIAARGLE